MKINNLFIVIFLIVMNSCSNNESATEREETNTSISARELGQIPVEIDLQSKISSVVGNDFAHINLLKEFKSKYGSADFYNNLFELTLYELFKSETFTDLGVNELRFLLQEVRNVESNMINIKNIPILLNSALDSGLITKNEFEDIARELVSKNEKEILSIQWNNVDIKKKNLADIENIKTILYYKRSRY